MTQIKFIDKLKKDFGSDKIFVASEVPDVEVISTGSISLDFATGVGGFPLGTIVEVFGPESIGKTTLSYYMIAEVQKAGYAAAFLNLEGRFSAPWAKKVAGVDLENLLVASPDPGTQSLEVLAKLVVSGYFRLVVFDSIGAMQADREQEIGGKKNVGGASGLVTQMVHQILPLAYRNNCTVVFLNQVRDVMGASVPMLESPGGHALKHSAVIRVELKRAYSSNIFGNIAGKKKEIGYGVNAFVKKNKVAAPKQIGEYRFVYEEVDNPELPLGIDRMGEIIELSLRLGVVRRGGSVYYHSTFPDGKISGKQEAIDYIRTHDETFSVLRDEIMQMAGKQLEEIEDDE